MPNKENRLRDPNDQILSYQALYKKALQVNGFQLQKIQRAETREVCISVLLRTVAICDNVLKEMSLNSTKQA